MLDFKADYEAYTKHRKPGVPTDADFSRLMVSTRGKLAQLGFRLNRGILDPTKYIQAVFDVLEASHAQAVKMGRNLGGDLSPIEDDDFAFAMRIMNEEAPFLNRFRTDILLGRYTDAQGRFKLGAINARANLYTGRIRGTANETFVLSSEPEDTFAWHDLTAESCAECPGIAAGGPYTAGQLFLIGYPAQGRQPCGGNCGCILVRLRDKTFGFTRSYD